MLSYPHLCHFEESREIQCHLGKKFRLYDVSISKKRTKVAGLHPGF